jgi:hypothetical protein
MGLLRLNPLVADLEGTLGEMVLAKHKPGVKITRKKPVRTVPPTEGELANRARMRCAVIYAKAVWANNPELKAKYNAAARLKFGDLTWPSPISSSHRSWRTSTCPLTRAGLAR